MALHHLRYWYGKKQTKQHRTQHAITIPRSAKAEPTQHCAETRAPPSQEPRDHTEQTDQFETLQHPITSNPNASNDPVSGKVKQKVKRIYVENQNRFSPKVYTELLNTKRNARFTKCQKPMASLSLIPFPFALHSLSSSSLAVTHGNTTNQNKDERCHILTLHRFTRFHLEPRMRNIPVF